MEALNQVLTLAPTLYIPSRGRAIADRQAVQDAVTAQRNALQSIYDQTITLINQGATLDEAAATVTLPLDFASIPYNQEFVSTVSAIVKNIYHEKLGWFSGNLIDLTSTLTEAGKAQALVDAFGLENLISAARNAELNARDLASAEQASTWPGLPGCPRRFRRQPGLCPSPAQKRPHARCAQARNYLTAASDLGTFVTDFTKPGMKIPRQPSPPSSSASTSTARRGGDERREDRQPAGRGCRH